MRRKKVVAKILLAIEELDVPVDSYFVRSLHLATHLISRIAIIIVVEMEARDSRDQVRCRAHLARKTRRGGRRSLDEKLDWYRTYTLLECQQLAFSTRRLRVPSNKRYGSLRSLKSHSEKPAERERESRDTSHFFSFCALSVLFRFSTRFIVLLFTHILAGEVNYFTQ